MPLSALLLILIAGAWNAPAAGANEVVRHLEHRAVLAPETLVELENLAGRIEMLEQALAEVRAEQDHGVPPTFASLGERIAQMLTLAQQEADEDHHEDRRRT